MGNKHLKHPYPSCHGYICPKAGPARATSALDLLIPGSFLDDREKRTAKVDRFTWIKSLECVGFVLS